MFNAAAIAGILLLALILRLAALDTIPQNLGGDEASQGLEAIRFLNGQTSNMFELGWWSVPNMSFLWQAGWFKLLGVSVFSLRLPWALIGTATVLVLYRLARDLFGVTVALVAASLLATFHLHIHFSRLGSNQIADGLLMLLALLFLLRGLTGARLQDFALCGVVLGLSLYCYAGARLVPVVVATSLGILALMRPRILWASRTGLASMGVAFFMVAGPILAVFATRPGEFNTRLNDIGIVQSGWLAEAQQVTRRSALSLLVEQFQRALFAFNVYTDQTAWYHAWVPYLESVGAVLFVFGLAFAMFRVRDVRFLPFGLWFWGAVVLGGALTVSPPSSQRLITLAPVYCLFIAMGLSALLHLVKNPGLARQSTLVGAGVVVVVWLAAWSLNFYFREYIPARLYGGENASLATSMGAYLRNLQGNYRVYFFGAPRMFWDFPSIHFLAPEAQGVDVNEPLQGLPVSADQSRKTIFLFVPERAEEVETVEQLFPGGRRVEMYPVDNAPGIQWLAYVLDPAGGGQR